MKVKVFWVRKLRCMIERGNPLFAVTQVTSTATTSDALKARTQQVIQNGTLIKLGLLKSGNLTNLCKIERRDPLWTHSTRTDSLLKTMRWILTPKQNQSCRWNPDHSCTGFMIKCRRGKNDLQWMLQKIVEDILWYGECSRLQHWNHLYSWWRITQIIGIPSRTQKISEWNKCSTYLRNWYPIKMRSMEWKQLTGKALHGSSCLWLVINRSLVFNAQNLRIFRIYYALERWTRTLVQT